MRPKPTIPAALAVGFASAQDASMNVTSLIAGNSNLTALAGLLTTFPNIATEITSRTNFTLFAPNNQALRPLTSSGMLTSNPNASSTNLIRAMFDYHILNGHVYAANISSTPQFPPTALNGTMYSNVTGGQVVECRRVDNSSVEIISGLKSVANVTQSDLIFNGGVVHVIDRLLSIPTNFSSVAQAANLTALLGATNAAAATETLDTATRGLTIFAPSNSAFQSIGSANLTAEQLQGVLQYHVLNGTVAYSSSLTNASQMTLAGSNLNITIADDGDVFVNSARVVVPDVLFSGGVIHVIDSMLNPNGTSNGTVPGATGTAVDTAYSGVSSASTVPFTSGVPTPSSSIAALVSTMTDVASGYSSVVPAGGGSATGGAGGGSGGSSSSSGLAAAPTGVVGAAALFGAAAFLANV